MARRRFTAIVRPSGRGGGGHLVEVPAAVVAALGGKGRIAVSATFNGIAYRGSIVRMGGSAMIGVTKAVMAEARVGVGDPLTVVVENDDEPREVEIPPELEEAFRRSQVAKGEWDRLSYSHRREHVGFIVEAKKEATRLRRVEKTIGELEEQGLRRG